MERKAKNEGDAINRYLQRTITRIGFRRKEKLERTPALRSRHCWRLDYDVWVLEFCKRIHEIKIIK